MQKPVHIDLKTLEATLRQLNASMLNQALASAPGPEAVAFYRLLEEAGEIFIRAHLQLARWRNAGVADAHQAKVIGNVLGMIAGAVLANYPGSHVDLLGYFQQAVNACASGKAPKGGIFGDAEFPIVRGGNA